MTSALATALAGVLGEPVARLDRVTGGDLNEAYAATLGGGERVFVKTSVDAAPGAFAAEAAGLRWLAVARALPVPQPLAVLDRADPIDVTAAASTADPSIASPDAGTGARAGDPAVRLLVLEWIESGPSSRASDELLGRGLARLHTAGAPNYGGPQQTLQIGPLTLPNQPARDWSSFYAERRLVPLAELAQQRGALPAGALGLLDRVVERLHAGDSGGGPGIGGPPEPPARLHGDLWGGNVLTDTSGQPWLIDPAAYGGHREVDLALLRLFGGPSERAFAAYEEVAPLAPGAAERVALWQLAPLLLHAALFGGGYGASAVTALRRYV
ncbi:fructosamine kinase family protein [Conexibacter sp. CPCC 206217]|uniref:fructosamine kinase family protein n=1 Tax=Conexibacter sp. CPCC 206217 TaxID=3064574 RepID=UPI0027178DAD|nr:fructosamine kinase family protein [Conexibacter sp. CPCC 206217]MDO8214112.1 fructosamine kinase family protein [Conexibacter sp. CPCC 206217]